MIRYFISLVVSLLLARCSAAAEATHVLVENGTARARIVLDEKAPPSTRFAAAEFQTYIRKATGVEIPITDSSRNDDVVEIVVGAGRTAAALGVTVEGLSRDAYRIQSLGKRIVILGRDDPNRSRIVTNGQGHASSRVFTFEHGTLYGVYGFLERFLGVRWYLPIDLGEVVPRCKTLAVPGMDLTVTPAKAGRFTHQYYGLDDRDDPWPPRNKKGAYSGGFRPGFQGGEDEDFETRRSLFFLRLGHETAPIKGSSHTLWKLISPARYGKSHPEYFALYPDGKRGANFADDAHSQHCFTSDGLIEELAGHAEAYCTGKPGKDRGFINWSGIGFETPLGPATHLAPDDAYRPCVCETCESFRAAEKQDGVQPQQIEADLVWSAMIKVARLLQERGVNGHISVQAYGPLNIPPRQELPKNILVGPIAVPGPYSEFIPGLREQEEQAIQSWVAKVGAARITGFYHYATKAGWENGRWFSHRSICGSIPRAFAACYKRYADIGMGTYLYQMSHSFPYDHLNNYVFYKYHWDPSLSVDALLSEYYALFYGPAQRPMGAFWEEVEAQFTKLLLQVEQTPIGPRYDMPEDSEVWGTIYGRPVLDRWKKYFDEAAILAKAHEDPVYAQRVAYMKRNVLDRMEEGLLAHENMISGVQALRLKAVHADRPPVLDGKLDDAVWQRAVPVHLVKIDSLEAPSHPTAVRMLWDRERLYLGMACKEPDLQAMKDDVNETDQPAKIWSDNGVEIFLDVDHQGKSLYQWLFSHKGIWADVHVPPDGKGDETWNSAFTGKVVEDTAGYVIEIAIPFSAFNRGAPDAGTVWAANFIRKRIHKDQPIGQAEFNTWSPYITRDRGFQRPQAFGKLEFVQ